MFRDNRFKSRRAVCFLYDQFREKLPIINEKGDHCENAKAYLAFKCCSLSLKLQLKSYRLGYKERQRRNLNQKDVLLCKTVVDALKHFPKRFRSLDRLKQSVRRQRGLPETFTRFVSRLRSKRREEGDRC